jgi:hypothetical protein
LRVTTGSAIVAQLMEGLCHAKTELLLAYQKAGVTYTKAVNRLSHCAGTIPEVKYKRLRVITERARKLSRAAKRALSVHVAEHRCGIANDCNLS